MRTVGVGNGCYSSNVEMKKGKTEKKEWAVVSYASIKRDEEINCYIEQGNKSLGVLGYTEHSKAHATKVARQAADILKELGYGRKEIELAKIAGYMHDIGNCINRTDHAHSGALLARSILVERNMPTKQIAKVITAIGQHDEKTGTPVDPISAAIILADKTDVRRNRVRNKNKAAFDKHDTVNYAVEHAKLTIDKEKKSIVFAIELDENICSVMDYFEIFLDRMLMCRKAAEQFGMKFKMTANGSKVC